MDQRIKKKVPSLKTGWLYNGDLYVMAYERNPKKELEIVYPNPETNVTNSKSTKGFLLKGDHLERIDGNCATPS